MKPTFVLLVGTVALFGAMGVVAADAGQTPPPWPDNETDDNATELAPGRELAGAVGAQGASVRSEVWNRTLAERLDNATTPAQRAEVVTEEVELLNASVEHLDESRENLTEAWDDDELSEGEYRASLSRFVVRAHAVERRANQTVRAAEDLPERTREHHDINVTRVEDLEERAEGLYEFEDEMAQEVANETLENVSADDELPWADGRED